MKVDYDESKTKSDSTIAIQDKYSHLKFKKMEDINQIAIGMMIQIIENNLIPLSWEWYEVDASIYKKLSSMIKSKYEFVRIPNY